MARSPEGQLNAMGEIVRLNGLADEPSPFMQCFRVYLAQLGSLGANRTHRRRSELMIQWRVAYFNFVSGQIEIRHRPHVSTDGGYFWGAASQSGQQCVDCSILLTARMGYSARIMYKLNPNACSILIIGGVIMRSRPVSSEGIARAWRSSNSSRLPTVVVEVHRSASRSVLLPRKAWFPRRNENILPSMD
jgi:hypothetical protein